MPTPDTSPALAGRPPAEVYAPADDPGACDAAGVYARHAATLYRYARRFGDSSLADDVVQEVFLRILLYKRSEAGSLTLPFLMAMTRNVALEAAARQRRRAGAPLDEGLAESIAAEAAPAPDGLLASLDALLEDLSQRQRDTLELVEARGLSENQAARALNMSRAAVSARRRKAVVRLRRIVSGAAEPRWRFDPDGLPRADAA